MPTVKIELIAGRDVEKKRELVKAVTDAVVATLACSPDSVTVKIEDMEPYNYSKAGVLWCDK